VIKELRKHPDEFICRVCVTAQHSTAQHSTAQHSTAQHSTAQHRQMIDPVLKNFDYIL
jgi:UDP-N-acetylglucosamine 2-epimerase